MITKLNYYTRDLVKLSQTSIYNRIKSIVIVQIFNPPKAETFGLAALKIQNLKLI